MESELKQFLAMLESQYQKQWENLIKPNIYFLSQQMKAQY